MRLCWVPGLIAFAACSSPTRPALDVVVSFGAGSEAKCIKLEFKSRGEVVYFSNPFPRLDKAKMSIGVGQTKELFGELTVIARGFVAADCSGPPSEASLEGAGSLSRPGVTRIELSLDGPNTLDAGCAARVETDCGDDLDEDCDGRVDCDDPDCLGLACAGGGTCNPTGCTGQKNETLCGDRLDNDGDGNADCDDSDCAAKSCSDGNACTTGETCTAAGCDGGVETVVCNNSQANCRGPIGVCIPADGGCVYPLLDAGAPCSDGQACTHSDICNATGSCLGTAYTCGPATACADAGVCLGDGGCSRPAFSAATRCDDVSSCTYGDHCSGSGQCTGTAYSCANAPTCFLPGACLGDGGCAFTPSPPGTSCPGGACAGDGGCVLSGFSFPPSNFNPLSIPDASVVGPTVFSNCTANFNSTTNTFSGWCGQAQPIPFVVAQDGGPQVTVLAMASLSIAPTGTLVLVGDRPVVLAVFGAVNVQGTIDARSLDTTRRGAGGSWSGCGAMAGGNATVIGGGGGGAFGGPGSNGASTGYGLRGIDGGDVDLVPLHGGCRGGDGSDGPTISPGGVGGGAVQISSSGSLTVSGTISASGAGGRPGLSGNPNNGGSGGASGGAIFLEGLSVDVTATAKLVVNGGGGGGGHLTQGGNGNPGQNGSLDTSVPALGGQGGSDPAGDGANGAAGSTGPGVATAGTVSGGGGGGGGLGRIRLNGINSCTIAPNGVLFSGVVSKSAGCP
jgi:hypothetical protein